MLFSIPSPLSSHSSQVKSRDIDIPCRRIINHIDTHDWSTFLNHLFPLRSADWVYNPVKEYLGDELTRRYTLRAVVAEWNNEFFIRRHIQLVPDIKPYRRSPHPNLALNFVDFKYPNGKTQLYTAVEDGNINTVRILLSYGADPNKPSFVSTSCVYCAVQKIIAGSEIHKGILETLILYGTRINARSDDGNTSMGLADDIGNAEVVYFLKKYQKHNEVIELSPISLKFRHAIASGDVPAVKHLLDSHPTKLYTHDFPITDCMIHFPANSAPHLEILTLLLESKRPLFLPNACPSDQKLPIHLAVIQNNLAATRLLLRRRRPKSLLRPPQHARAIHSLVWDFQPRDPTGPALCGRKAG
jgi:hypothetical protein